MPTSAVADNVTPVVLFGTGLTLGTSVYFDSDISGIRANNVYVSPTGTVLVFTVPTNVSAGSHTLIIHNGSGLTSPSLPFMVSSI